MVQKTGVKKVKTKIVKKKSAVSLKTAIDSAVSTGLKEMTGLEKEIKGVFDEIKKSTTLIDEWLKKSTDTTEDRQRNSSANLLRILKDKQADISVLVNKQKENLKTFNIALFGRTGAGKSTLIEAFTKGNGESVSRGESDWTTDVKPRDWNSCRLYDTPGINGWGRTMARNELEDKARKAVEVADIVILCFDSQSQQISEFEKIAEWIQKYGKPALVILNCRNPRWRMPLLVRKASSRRQLSQSLHDHATNIRDELGKIGIKDPIIIAMSNKRALFARASLPFKAPDENTLIKHRELYGVTKLLRWSNFSILQDLLVEGLSSDAGKLRLGMLRNQIRGEFQILLESISHIDLGVQSTLPTIEKTIEDFLNLLGYPQENCDLRNRIFSHPSSRDDLLTDLEKARNIQFQSPLEGEFSTFLTRSVNIHFSDLRRTSFREAENLIARAFDQEREVGNNEFSRCVFNEKAIEAAQREVVSDIRNFLEARSNVIFTDAKNDFECEKHQLNIGGNDGKWWDYSGTGLKIAGILTGLGGTFAALAVTNIWNPLGWTMAVAGAVAAAGGLISLVLNWIGGKCNQKAETKRLAARREALANANECVRKAFDSVEEKLSDAIREEVWKNTGQVMQKFMLEAIGLRKLEQAMKYSRETLESSLTSFPIQTPSTVFLDAAQRIEQSRVTKPGRSNIWLGDLWLNDPEGLEEEEQDVQPERETAHDPGFLENMLDKITNKFKLFYEKPAADSGKEWFDKLKEGLDGQPEEQELIEHLEAIATDGKPHIYLCGDYNSGKSSFIKRLLADNGQNIPEHLEVSSLPETQTVQKFEWNGANLFDCPGFQSSREEDEKETLNHIADAATVFYLFQPNLVMGSPEFIKTVLLGNTNEVLIPKLERTMFIVNRTDEFGIDPYDDPELFTNLCDRKRKELILAMEAYGVRIDESRVFFISSDPYGLSGKRTDVTSEHFREFLAWDGLGVFKQAFRKILPTLQNRGTDISLLESGSTRLYRLINQYTGKISIAERENRVHESLVKVIKDAICEIQQIKRISEHKLDKILEQQALDLLDGVYASTTDEELKAYAERLSKWWEDPLLHTSLAEWLKNSQDEYLKWLEKFQDRFSRRFISTEARYIFPELKDYFEHENFSRKDSGFMGKFISTFEKLAKAGGVREIVYKVGKKVFAVKFKPWGAVKMAAKIGKFAAVLGAIGVAIDIYDLFAAAKSKEKRNKVREKARKFIKDTVSKIKEQILNDPDPKAKGLSAQINQNISDLQGSINEEDAKIKAQKAEIDRLKNRIELYQSFIDEALKHLGQTIETGAVNESR